MEEKATNLMQEADAALDAAARERMRPEQDVVAYSVCHNSRQSIRMHLTSYLLKHGVSADADASITELLNRCAAINPEFSKVDVSEIRCRGDGADNAEYCLAVRQVTNCFEAATEVRKLIHSIR
jgi:RNase adaptor protein for sRNA GlmZ degradation